MKAIIKEKLKELEETRNDFWNLPPESGNFINMLIKSHNAKRVLEIGTSNGYSAIWICEALEKTGGKLVSLEFWQKRIDLAVPNLEHCGLAHRANIKCGSAIELVGNLTPDDFELDVESLEAQLDIVFIDANKGEYIDYFNAIHPLLKKGGIILSDNVSSHPKPVKPFLDAIYSHAEYQTQLLDFDGGLLMSVKV